MKKDIDAMTVGLPGTGIGGVFYLLSAFFMPIVEIVMTLRGKSSVERWSLVIRQLIIGLVILGAMWLLGLIIGVAFDMFHSTRLVTMSSMSFAGSAVQTQTHIVQTAMRLNVFHIAPVVMSIVSLSVILMLTNIMRLFIRPLAEEV